MLVIIDVQTYYTKDKEFVSETDYSLFLEQMNKRLYKARTSNEDVIILLEQHSGQLEPRLASLISENIPAAKTYILCKEYWDGSDEIQSIIKEQKLEFQEIHLSGLFKEACVYETWKGLKEKHGLSTDRLRVDQNLVISCFLYKNSNLPSEFLTCH